MFKKTATDELICTNAAIHKPDGDILYSIEGEPINTDAVTVSTENGQMRYSDGNGGICGCDLPLFTESANKRPTVAKLATVEESLPVAAKRSAKKWADLRAKIPPERRARIEAAATHPACLTDYTPGPVPELERIRKSLHHMRWHSGLEQYPYQEGIDGLRTSLICAINIVSELVGYLEKRHGGR